MKTVARLYYPLFPPPHQKPERTLQHVGKIKLGHRVVCTPPHYASLDTLFYPHHFLPNCLPWN